MRVHLSLYLSLSLSPFTFGHLIYCSFFNKDNSQNFLSSYNFKTSFLIVYRKKHLDLKVLRELHTQNVEFPLTHSNITQCLLYYSSSPSQESVLRQLTSSWLPPSSSGKDHLHVKSLLYRIIISDTDRNKSKRHAVLINRVEVTVW